jgi:hypothetical protein
MKKVTIGLLVCFFPAVAWAQFSLVEGIDSAQVRAINLMRGGKTISVLTHNGLLRSRNGGEFKTIAIFKDELPIGLVAGLDDQTDYVVTMRNLYKATLVKERLYSCPEDVMITGLVLFNNKLYLGTTTGVYTTEEKVVKFHRLRQFKEERLKFFKVIDNKLYLGTDRGVYAVNSEERVEKIFDIKNSDDGLGLEINDIILDQLDLQKMYLASNRGLFVSQDKEKNFVPLNASGLSRGMVYGFIQDNTQKKSLYLATPQGLLRVDLSLSEPQVVIAAMPGEKILSGLFIDSDLYLVAGRGLFKNSIALPPRDNDFANTIKNEPHIDELIKVILHYNEVNPEKIKRWRKALKLRALMPKFDLDYSKTMNYDSKSYRYIRGPRDWGAGLSWDLSELLWNSYEDDVDTRARLDTQMRLDMIDEINRIYFERLRVRRELSLSGLSTDEAFSRNVRMAELTAALDGYSGGWFSNKLSELQKCAK